MTEAGWNTGVDPDPLLEFVRGKAAARKLWLFATGCCRRVGPLLREGDKEAVRVAERFADRRPDSTALHAAASGASAPPVTFLCAALLRNPREPFDAAVGVAVRAADLLRRQTALDPARDAGAVHSAERAGQCRLLREILGSPFRPVGMDPAWLRGGTVARLARSIYAEWAFDRLPVLADALEDAGCADAEVLAHCRLPGRHVRGCWVVDLLLDGGRGPMTEAEWLACPAPQTLLDYHAARATHRKLRLFACGCCRAVWPLLGDRWSREAVETAENFADRQADRHDFAVARETAAEALRWAGQKAADAAAKEVAVDGARAAHGVTLENAEESARRAALHAARAAVAAGHGALEVVKAAQADLFRDVFGNPFRPVVFDPSWFHWQDGGVKKLARAIYEGGRFADVAALGEALVKAGCVEEQILAHCRSGLRHVRGCWVLDLLLGKT